MATRRRAGLHCWRTLTLGRPIGQSSAVQRFVELLCRRGASAPVGYFGYLLTYAHRAALDAAGVHVTRVPRLDALADARFRVEAGAGRQHGEKKLLPPLL